MPDAAKIWRHVIVNTRCTWLHGDERGSFARGKGYEPASERRRLAAEALMTDDPVRLTPDQRAAV